MAISGEPWGPGDLQALAGLTADQWQAVQRGGPQARIVDTKENREVAVFGIAHLHSTAACFTTMLRDIENFKKDPAVLRIRKFEKPVEPHDLEGLRLEEADVAGLVNCRVGACNVKLPAATIQRFGRDVDRSRPDYATTSQEIFREELLAYLETYLNHGDSALIEYRDKRRSVRLADEFGGLLDARPGVAGFAPEFYAWLARGTGGTWPDVDQFLYWSTESFGLKPVTSITHVSIYKQPGRAVVASKQIYASHYFDGSLGVTVALDDPSRDPGAGMYLVYLNRSRIDLLEGILGGWRRAALRSRLVDGTQKYLVQTVQKLESSCGEHPGSTPRDR